MEEDVGERLAGASASILSSRCATWALPSQCGETRNSLSPACG
jgi:hypothetical protein